MAERPQTFEDFPIPAGCFLGPPYFSVPWGELPAGISVTPVRWTAGMAELFRLARERESRTLAVLEDRRADGFENTFCYRDVIPAVGAGRVGVVIELNERYYEVLFALRAGDGERAFRLIQGSSFHE